MRLALASPNAKTPGRPRTFELKSDALIAVDFVVAANDDAKLAIVAGAKHGRRIGTDVIEIDRSVPGGIHRAKFPIGLFHQKRNRRVNADRWRSQKAEVTRLLYEAASS